MVNSPRLEAARSVELYVRCVAGALLKKDYLEAIRAAGFPEIEIAGQQTFGIDVLDADPNLCRVVRLLRWLPMRLIARTASSVVSMKVTARKPA